MGVPENLGTVSLLSLCKKLEALGILELAFGMMCCRTMEKKPRGGTEETQAQKPSDQLHRDGNVKFSLEERGKAVRSWVPRRARTGVGGQFRMQDLGQE